MLGETHTPCMAGDQHVLPRQLPLGSQVRACIVIKCLPQMPLQNAIVVCDVIGGEKNPGVLSAPPHIAVWRGLDIMGNARAPWLLLPPSNAQLLMPPTKCKPRAGSTAATLMNPPVSAGQSHPQPPQQQRP